MRALHALSGAPTGGMVGLTLKVLGAALLASVVVVVVVTLLVLLSQWWL